MTDEILIAEILPPMLRRDLIHCGNTHDIDGIDDVHRRAIRDYPEKFRSDDVPDEWGKRYEFGWAKRATKE